MAWSWCARTGGGGHRGFAVSERTDLDFWDVSQHPLKYAAQAQTSSGSDREKKKGADVTDAPNTGQGRGKPASQVSSQPVALDPLSAMAAGLDLDDEPDFQSSSDDQKRTEDEAQSQRPLTEADERWRQIMSETCQSGANNFAGKIRAPESLHHLLEKLKMDSDESTLQARLDLLEGKTSHRSLARDGLSSREFGRFAELVNDQLAKFWRDDQRVSVIKLTIQVCKLLGEPDESSLEYYPAIFFQLCDLISYFGQLVYDRLVTKCPGLKVNFTSEDVSPEAQELCNNWLLKISSVREVVPRFYLEAAFLRCYRFQESPENFTSIFDRLTRMVRGFSNPLVASYARAFLVHMAQQVVFTSNPALATKVARQNYEEFLLVYKYCGSSLADYKPSLKMETYLDMFKPVIDWLLASQQFGMDTEKKDHLTRRCFAEADSAKHPALIYQILLKNASTSIIEGDISHLVQLVSSCSKVSDYSVHGLVCTFGQSLLRCASLARAQKLEALNAVWGVVTSMDDIEAYLSCAVIWTEFTFRHFDAKEVNTLLGDIIGHTNKALSANGGSGAEGAAFLQKIVQIFKILVESSSSSSVASNSASLWTTLSLGNFLPLFDLMEAKDKADLAKTVLERVVATVGERRKPEEVEEEEERRRHFSDPVIIHVLVYMSEILADSVNALSIQDETRQISQLLCHVIRLVDYEDDFEQQLKYFTECRGKFFRLDAVQIQLVHCVNLLAVRTRNKMQGRLTARARGFLQACCAFVFITIPSIGGGDGDHLTQMRLSLHAAEVAYMCRCLGQGEANLRAAIKMTTEVEKMRMAKNLTPLQVEQRLSDFLSSLFSLLLVVPDNTAETESGAAPRIYLIRGALKAINRFPWDPNAANKALVYVKVIRLLSTIVWESYPYHIAGLDSNDVLYGASDQFVQEANSVATDVLNELLGLVQHLSKASKTRQAAEVSWHLVQAILTCADLDAAPELAGLAKKLWNLSQADDVVARKSAGMRQRLEAVLEKCKKQSRS